jgi:hypothetical protein
LAHDCLRWLARRDKSVPPANLQQKSTQKNGRERERRDELSTHACRNNQTKRKREETRDRTKEKKRRKEGKQQRGGGGGAADSVATPPRCVCVCASSYGARGTRTDLMTPPPRESVQEACMHACMQQRQRCSRSVTISFFFLSQRKTGRRRGRSCGLGSRAVEVTKAEGAGGGRNIVRSTTYWLLGLGAGTIGRSAAVQSGAPVPSHPFPSDQSRSVRSFFLFPARVWSLFLLCMCVCARCCTAGNAPSGWSSSTVASPRPTCWLISLYHRHIVLSSSYCWFSLLACFHLFRSTIIYACKMSTRSCKQARSIMHRHSRPPHAQPTLASRHRHALVYCTPMRARGGLQSSAAATFLFTHVCMYSSARHIQLYLYI